MIAICNLWSTDPVQWSSANWTWEDCQTINQVCNLWSKTGDLWSNAGFIWGANCTSGSIPPIPILQIGNPPGVDASTLIPPWLYEEPWNPYKKLEDKEKKRVIKLLCKIKGINYNEEKIYNDFDVKVKDIQFIVKNSGINLKVEK